ncbi:tail assembly protein [Bordetella ansorpii]|nr:tail assembly protein [Bordetella ansorpii]
MSQPLVTVRLYGRLGAQFGRVHRFAVMSASEAVQALCATVRGFEREFLADGIRYACFLGRRNLSEEDLMRYAGAEDIRIAPVLQGRKRSGLFQTILGAAFIAASFIPGLNVAVWAGASVTYGSLLGVGMALALGGITQMLAPQQRGLSTRDSPDNGASYNFNGPVNTTAQGNPVPVLYGEMFVGSAVVSAGIYAEDQA